MKMAKASEADLKMALDLTQALEAFERGHFPYTDDMDNTEEFDRDNRDDCLRAMEMLLDILQKGSMFRVVFGMTVLLDPKNEAVDPACDHLEHHPKVRMHDELIGALRAIVSFADRNPFESVGVVVEHLPQNARAVLAKADGR